MDLKFRVNTEQKVNNFPKIRPEEKCARQLDTVGIIILFKQDLKIINGNNLVHLHLFLIISTIFILFFNGTSSFDMICLCLNLEIQSFCTFLQFYRANTELVFQKLCIAEFCRKYRA